MGTVVLVIVAVSSLAPPTAGDAPTASFKSPAEFEHDPFSFSDDQNLTELEEVGSRDGLSRFITMPLLNFYRKYVSPAKGFHCPMYPSCSSYGKEAFSRYNPLRAFWMTSSRLTRCGHDLEYYRVVTVEGEFKFYDPVEP